MKITDLGPINGPVLLFGGPYSNLQATQALIGAAQHHQIPAQNVICTGDIVAYCGAPQRTVTELREFGCHVVAGNMEQALAQGAAGCGCGFDAGSTCDLLARRWFAYADQQIDAGARKWMAQLPEIITFDHSAGRTAVIHGGARDTSKFLWSTTPNADLEVEWSKLQHLVGPLQRVVAGHSGLAFQRRLSRGTWANAGVIGLPPHDGATATRYAILSESLTLHALEYDVQAAVRDMERAQLTDGYHTALQTGYWPSEDVLPGTLRKKASESG